MRVRPENSSRETWQATFLRLFPKVRLNEPMSRHTTFRIGGPADAYLEILNFEDLAKVFRFAGDHRIAVFLLGWGSNLLVRDGGIRGIVLRLRGDFESICFDPGAPRVQAGAGVRLPTLVAACAEKGLTGAESLIGVPGTVGGGLVMNAGTREGEIGDIIRRVRVFDTQTLREEWIQRSKLDFQYRRSSLENYVILAAELELKRGSKVDILKHIRELQKRRRETQPIHTYNVGSTFKNPPGHFVAKLIEEAGLKGFCFGGAKVSEKHANFFENANGATARDVLALVDHVRGKIRDRFGVELEMEMKVVGEP